LDVHHPAQLSNNNLTALQPTERRVFRNEMEMMAFREYLSERNIPKQLHGHLLHNIETVDAVQKVRVKVWYTH